MTLDENDDDDLDKKFNMVQSEESNPNYISFTPAATQHQPGSNNKTQDDGNLVHASVEEQILNIDIANFESPQAKQSTIENETRSYSEVNVYSGQSWKHGKCISQCEG